MNISITNEPRTLTFDDVPVAATFRRNGHYYFRLNSTEPGAVVILSSGKQTYFTSRTTVVEAIYTEMILK